VDDAEPAGTAGQRHVQGAQTLLLVGHDPDFSALVQSLTGTRVSFPKAGAAMIDPIAGDIVIVVE